MGCRFSEETMKELLAAGKVLFGEDPTKIVELKLYAHECADRLPSGIILDGRLGAYQPSEIFRDNKKTFDNTKPRDLISPISAKLAGRVANAVTSYVIYLAKTVWPSNLAFFYPNPGVKWPLQQVVGCLVLLVLITYMAFRLRRTRPYLAVGWAWYVVTLLPVIGLLQVGSQGRAELITILRLLCRTKEIC